MRDKLDLVADMEGFLEWNSDMSRTCGIKCEPYDRTKHKISVQSKEILDEEKLTRNEKRRKLRYERKIEEWIMSGKYRNGICWVNIGMDSYVG